MRRSVLCATALALTGLVVAGCGKSEDKAAAGGTTVRIELTDAGCAPSPDSVPAGPVTFKVTNVNAGTVTEAEVMQGDTIIGEKENLTPGLSGSFSLSLKAGDYTVYCPNAATEKTAFKVTGGGGASQDPAVQAALDKATDGYKQYVTAEVDKLVPAAKKFTDAVRAGDIAQAQQLYAPARYYYEEVEPVAESFGDLDRQLDARDGDLAPGTEWSGFHKLEQDLWQKGSVGGSGATADKLLADVQKLQALVATATFKPLELANGAKELLDEVASSKVTGEEDRYSHTDLWDFQANVEGSKAAVAALRPALDARDSTLGRQLDAQFAAVQRELDKYRSGDQWRPYTDLTPDQVKALSDAINGLAEPISQLAVTISR